MQSKKPRIATTLEPETFAVIASYAELTGQSLGATVAQLLDSAVPHMKPTIKLLEKAKNAPEEMKRQFIEKLENNVNTLEKALFEASQTDFITGEKPNEKTKKTTRNTKKPNVR